MRFIAHTAVFRDHVAHEFDPGDEVPDWAVDLVGPHVAAGEAPAAPDAEAESEEGQESAEEPAEESQTEADAPDFTKPAPRRTRARKQD